MPKLETAISAYLLCVIASSSCKQDRCVTGFHESGGECVSDVALDAGCSVAIGGWNGSTDQSLPIRFVVGSGAASVTEIHLEANVTTASGSKKLTVDNSGPVAVTACRFIASVGGGQVSATLIEDGGTASGTWSQTLVEGETAYTASGTWSANPCDAGCTAGDAGAADAGAVDSGTAVDAGGWPVAREISVVTGFSARVFADALVSPTGVAIDSAGRVFVAEYVNDRVLRFEADGGGRQVFADRDAGVIAPLALAIGAGDVLHIACSGRIVTLFDGGTGLTVTATGFSGGGLVELSPGTLAITEAALSSGGSRLFRVDVGADASVIASTFSSPYGVGVIDAGRVLVTEADLGFGNADSVSYYEVLMDDGGAVVNLTPIPLIALPGPIAGRSGGSVFAVGETHVLSSSSARVFLYNRATNATSELAAGFIVPMGVAFFGTTRLFVTEFSRGRIVVIEGSF
ncbi:MAG: hypothetical protein HYY84_09095 [Deltaproteobacteria bacterium]|nr:hypothetical protein [Deltaproteobacteria bacterium]